MSMLTAGLSWLEATLRAWCTRTVTFRRPATGQELELAAEVSLLPPSKRDAAGGKGPPAVFARRLVVRLPVQTLMFGSAQVTPAPGDLILLKDDAGNVTTWSVRSGLEGASPVALTRAGLTWRVECFQVGGAP